ncbi:hypothetical protein DFS34DRAFT_638414 [Phlyctochytrium arcticum]|nr:hypothetical protein DFS34DRAFT_638414 [Phlyctochytrium arcticum]
MAIVRLPPEISIVIIKKIDHRRTLVNCVYVCQSWRRIIRPLLYRQVTLRNQATFDLCLEQLTAEPHLGKLVQSLILLIYRDPLPSRVSSLWKLCPNLKKFVSDQNKRIPYDEMVQDDHVEALVNSCKQLDTISIVPVSALTDRSIVAIAANCPHLRELTILKKMADAYEITDASVKKLIDGCPMLDELILNGTYITAEGADYMINKGKNLKLLDLSGCLINSDEAEILDTLTPPCLQVFTEPPEPEAFEDEYYDEWWEEEYDEW